MNPSSLFSCLVVAGVCVSGLQANSVSLEPAEDTFIQGGNFAHEVRRNDYLEVAARGASDKDGLRKIFLAFDVDKEAAAKLVSARLVLSYRPGSTLISSDDEESAPVTVALYGGVSDEWSEEFLTWSEAPLHDATRASESGNSSVIPLAEQTIDPASPSFGPSIEFSDERLTSFVREHPGRFTLIMTSEGQPSMPGLRFFDKDGTKNPELKPTLILEMK